MRGSRRLRTLFVLSGLAAAVLVATVVYSVGRTAVETALESTHSPEQIQAVSEALRGAILAGALASLLLIVPVSLWIGGFARRPLVDLRAALGRRRQVTLRRATGLAEADALAAGFARLLTEHERTVAGLLRERDELAFLVDSVGEGIVQIGANGRFIHANRTAREMLGLPDAVGGQPVPTVVRNAGLRTLFEAVRKGRAVDPVELTLDGRRILVASHPLEDEDGRGIGAVAVLVDLTHLHRLENVRRDFVANASHELKTPLTSIRGYAETLRADDDMPEETRRQFLATIHQNAERLHRIVEDLLDLSRLESGGWRPDLQELQVGALAEDAWKGLSERADEKRIAFVVEEADAEARALADPVAVRQILSNLYDNAIRHTPEGGRITVLIRRSTGPLASAAGRTVGAAVGRVAAGALPPLVAGRRDVPTGERRWILVEVADTGTGIPRDALPRVFERFYRVDPARSRAEGGTGLGLAIVKHLVESMGGDVVAESELGKGTTFRFWLPATPASVPAS